jgi:aromatic ring-opening dioxygenase catalytic subunit (LigB family)
MLYNMQNDVKNNIHRAGRKRQARTCGEGLLHGTAMLLGLLEWDKYDRGVKIIGDFFAASGTGQVNAIFPVDGCSDLQLGCSQVM